MKDLENKEFKRDVIPSGKEKPEGIFISCKFRVTSSNRKNTEQLEFSHIAGGSKIDIVWGHFLIELNLLLLDHEQIQFMGIYLRLLKIYVNK